MFLEAQFESEIFYASFIHIDHVSIHHIFSQHVGSRDQCACTIERVNKDINTTYERLSYFRPQAKRGLHIIPKTEGAMSAHVRVTILYRLTHSETEQHRGPSY